MALRTGAEGPETETCLVSLLLGLFRRGDLIVFVLILCSQPRLRVAGHLWDSLWKVGAGLPPVFANLCEVSGEPWAV